MEQELVLKKLRGSTDMVKMLELLIDGIDHSGAEIPWTGFGILLSQSREMLQSTFEDLPKTNEGGARRTNSVVKADDTIHLLKILGQLMEILSRNKTSEIPWEGIKHTLSHTKEILGVMLESLSAPQVESPNGEPGEWTKVEVDKTDKPEFREWQDVRKSYADSVGNFVTGRGI